jgi:hypothetical protein
MPESESDEIHKALQAARDHHESTVRANRDAAKKSDRNIELLDQISRELESIRIAASLISSLCLTS